MFIPRIICTVIVPMCALSSARERYEPQGYDVIWDCLCPDCNGTGIWNT